MRDQYKALLLLVMDLLEFPDQHRETPQIDPRLRLIKDTELMRLRQHGRDLQALHLTARKRRIYFTPDIFLGT